MKEINFKLKDYIEKEIIPTYDTFDHGHDSRHACAVIKRSLDLAQFLNDPNLNIDMVYTTAAFHDMGMTIARKGHAKFSHDLVLKNEKLKEFFSPQEILTIAEACEDHSTSTGHTPRSVYGKIVSDADKDNDLSISLMRAWDFSIYHSPELTTEQHINEIHKQIQMRFGKGGSVKFYLPAPKNQEFLATMREFAENKKLFFEKMKELLARENQIDKQ